MVTRERELIVRFKDAKEAISEAKERLAEATKSRDDAERELLELLQAEDKESTARYDGLGFCSISRPVVYASCLKENEDKLFSYLREQSRGDLVKEAVNSRSLSSYIRELIDTGGNIPEFISYYLKTGIRFYAK